MLLFYMFNESISITIEFKSRYITNETLIIHTIFYIFFILPHLLETVDDDTEYHIFTEDVDHHPK